MRFRIFTLLAMFFTHAMSHSAPAAERFILPYRVSEAAFDSNNSRAFVVPDEGWWIDVIDLETRTVSGRFDFTSRPDSIAIAPNGEHMYVALTKGHVNSTDLMRWGSVAVFELEPLRLLREIEVQIDPDDIVATDSGHLVIAGGSGSSTEVGVFSAATGEKVGSWGSVNRGMNLALHPSQRIVYGTDTQGTARGFHHFVLSSSGTLAEQWKVPFLDAFFWGQNIIPFPDGLTLLDGYGKLRASSTDQTTDLREIGEIGFSSFNSLQAAFNTNRNLMAVVGGYELLFYDYETNRVLEIRKVPWAQFVDFYQDQVVVIAPGVPSEFLFLRENAKTAEENIPPTAFIQPVDTNVVLAVGSTLNLRAEGRDEDGNIASLKIFSGTNQISEANPYVLPGTNLFYAIAYDTFGASGTSAVLRVYGNIRPQTQIGIIPTRYPAPQTVTIPVTATDQDGTVQMVRFLVEGRVVAEDTTAPFEFEFTPPRPGQYSVEFEAVDDLGFSSLSGGLRLLQFEGPSDNLSLDIFVQTSTNLTLTGSTVDATRQKGEPLHAGVEGGKSVWWAWRAPSTISRGMVTIDTFGSNFDTLLAVYSPATNRTADFTRLSLIAANDDDITTPPGSRVKFMATANHLYYIVVDGRDGVGGNMQMKLHFSEIPALANDHLAVAASFTSALGTAGNNIGASKEPGEPPHAGNSGGASVWWRFEANAGSLVQLSTSESNFDTLLAVYTTNVFTYRPGPPLMTELSLVAENDDVASGTRTSKVSFIVPKSGRYWVAVDGYNGAEGTFRIQRTISFFVTVGNDAFISAGLLTGSAVVTNGFTIGATVETGEPLHADQPNSGSVWYRWTAPTNGLVSLSTRTSNFDTLLAAYTGSALTNLVRVAANDDNPAAPPTSAVKFHAAAGTEYYIAIAGYKQTRGSYVLALNFSPVNLPRLTTEWARGTLWLNVADADGIMVVETSTNLVHWAPVQTVNGGEEAIEIVRRPGVVKEFYRVTVVNE